MSPPKEIAAGCAPRRLVTSCPGFQLVLVAPSFRAANLGSTRCPPDGSTSLTTSGGRYTKQNLIPKRVLEPGEMAHGLGKQSTGPTNSRLCGICISAING